MSPMKFSSVLSTNPDALSAADEVCELVRNELGAKPADAAFLFIAGLYGPEACEAAVRRIRKGLGPRVLAGCTTGGIIGQDQEVEQAAGISLAAACIPRARLQAIYISPEELALSSPGEFWIRKLGAAPQEAPSFIILPDPYTSDVFKLISQLESSYPDSAIIGGLASGKPPLTDNLIFVNGDVYPEGCALIRMSGEVRLSAIVSQGCRPIGKPMKITRSVHNFIFELNGAPVISVLKNLLSSLNERDQGLAQHSLFVGLAIDPDRPYFERGDFLIRNIVGFDQQAGAMAVGDHEIHKGQVVQFQLRDARAAEEDFKILLELEKMTREQNTPVGALLFSCLGRGAGLFGEKNHDVRLVKKICGDFPVSGFFCNGEIGPIGGKTFVHGYTSCLGLILPKKAALSLER